MSQDSKQTATGESDEEAEEKDRCNQKSTEKKNRRREGDNGDDSKRDDDSKCDDEKSEKNDRKDEDKKDQDKPEEPKKPPLYKRPVPMLVIGVVLVVGIIAGVIWWLHARQYESTDDAFIDNHIVTISPNVAATVLAVHVDDNQRVKKGDLLVELDPRDFQVVVDQMRANLAGAQGRVQDARVQSDIAKANVTEAQAELLAAQTDANNAHRDYLRYASVDERARSQQQLDNATAAAKSSSAQVQQANAKVVAAQASVAQSQVAIKVAESAADLAQADLNQALINLGYCRIVAPSDGLVTRKNVEPGDYVEKAQPLFSIVPTEVWVTANYKETQLDLMRVGQPVTIEVDAYPSHQFHGKVQSIQNGSGSQFSLLPPENATGNYVKIVQRVPVKIVFDPGEIDHIDFLLSPGLSVVPTVKVR